jgi:hypothetical protein
MFPPAARSFEAALQETSSLESTLNRPWMVGSDIVLDTEHTHKLLGVNLGAHSAPSPFRLCILATEDPTRVLAEATAILKKEPPVTISSIEVKTSPTSLAETLQHYGPFCAALNRISQRMDGRKSCVSQSAPSAPPPFDRRLNVD